MFPLFISFEFVLLPPSLEICLRRKRKLQKGSFCCCVLVCVCFFTRRNPEYSVCILQQYKEHGCVSKTQPCSLCCCSLTKQNFFCYACDRRSVKITTQYMYTSTCLSLNEMWIFIHFYVIRKETMYCTKIKQLIFIITFYCSRSLSHLFLPSFSFSFDQFYIMSI